MKKVVAKAKALGHGPPDEIVHGLHLKPSKLYDAEGMSSPVFSKRPMLLVLVLLAGK